MGPDPGHPYARDDIDNEGSTTQGNVHDRDKLEYRSEDTVTIDRTEKAAYRTTVTNFQGESLHPAPRYAIDKGGLHYRPNADVDPVEGIYNDAVRQGPVEESRRTNL